VTGVCRRTYSVHSTYFFFCTSDMISLFRVKPTMYTVQWALAKRFAYKFNSYGFSKERETKNLQPELSHRIHSRARQHVNLRKKLRDNGLQANCCYAFISWNATNLKRVIDSERSTLSIWPFRLVEFSR
jgi:hypothetical protein